MAWRSAVLSFVIIATVQIWSQASNESRNSTKVQKVDFCTLVQYPEKFDGREVITTAILGDAETALLYDDRCKSTATLDLSTNAVFDKDKYHFGSKLDKKFDSVMKKNGEAQIKARGIFHIRRGAESTNGCAFKLDISELLSVDKRPTRPKKVSTSS
jgi:hypothetical protein